MGIIKISVLLRSPGVAWAYKNEKGTDLWNDLNEKVFSAVAPIIPVRIVLGSFLQHYFFLSDKDALHYKKAVDQSLDLFFGDTATRKSIGVSAAEPTLDELNELVKKSSDKSDAVFWEAIDELINQKAQKGNPKKEPEHTQSAKNPKTALKSFDIPSPEITIEQQSSDNTNNTDNAENTDNADKEKAPLLLSQQAELIKQLKETLLNTVKGQRHAIEEVVQAIFQSEMFSSFNEERKSPLATFLFTGPSGVGKTLLARTCKNVLKREALILDMSEFSDHIAHMKFNGEHGQPALVTDFVLKNPKSILVFDEIEKASINTIHLFLQILDAGTLKDYRYNKDVSFKDTIIIFTTNAGKSLYEDTTVCDLSGIPRSVILNALKTDINPQTREPFFPECITTRMSNGHVILFNRLEPYALMEIIQDMLKLQGELFCKSTGITIDYDPVMLSALVLYNSGGLSDARNIGSIARNMIAREIRDVVMQLYSEKGEKLDNLKKITISVDTECSSEIGNMFVSREELIANVFSDKISDDVVSESKKLNVTMGVTDNCDAFRRSLRGVTDYVLVDPMCGARNSDRMPKDVEDIDSDGMNMFDYVREFFSEIPVYILDTCGESYGFYETLLARGARGIIRSQIGDTESFIAQLKELTFGALVNNTVYSLGRSGKFLDYNCAQYTLDEETVLVSIEKLKVKSAPQSADKTFIAAKGANDNLTFKDVVGCKTAKEVLKKYCANLDNPRDMAMQGKAMPKGVLLYGPPGTGKTMLAKAMANECNATFFPVSGTSFFGSYVGQTEGNIRELFRKARSYAPSIIFIDEVDAIARARGGINTKGHNEDALTTFLAEMDGFVSDPKRPVFILAATNYEISGAGDRMLDPAFVRRFDNKILIPLPDTDDRYELIKGYLEKHGVHFGENHEKILRNMAERSGGMSNADLAMMNSNFIKTMGDGVPDGAKYLEALDAFRFGDVNKMEPEKLRQTACHEAGHAIVCRLCGITPTFLTIVSRGNYGGFMESAGKENGNYTFDELKNIVCRCLAGRLAEIELYGESLGTNTGAVSDIKKARGIVRAILDDYAMGDGLYDGNKPEEAEKLIKEQYDRTRKMLKDHRGTLERLTELLTQHKSLDSSRMEEFFKSENI